ncbi:MAG: IS1182 family transposase [Acidimicrobiia bacterium]
MQGQADPQQGFYDTMAVCGHLIPEGSVHRFLAEHREELFPPGLFSDLYPSDTGRPSVPPGVVATVILLQALEGLSDREAIERLARDVAWKAACGLSLAEEPFHPTVLTYFRRRLRASERPERIFEAVREVVHRTGVLRGRDRRALDSTLLEDAVATQDTVTQIASAIRRTRRVVPELGSVPLDAHDYSRPGKPECDWSDPEAREALVTSLVNDALALLEAAEGCELTQEREEAVGLLALVSGQDVEPGDEAGTWRIARRVAHHRVISTVDPEARHAHKSNAQHIDGYKAHVAVEPETGLMTACDLTPANAADGPVGVGLLAAEESPRQVIADSAYGSGETRVTLEAEQHRLVIKPAPLRAAFPGAFTLDDFTIDLDAGTATCPAGHTVSITPTRRADFRSHCQGCPLRARCTRAKQGRRLVLTPYHRQLADARQRARDPGFIATYRTFRPMVERSIAWLTRNNRKLRYRGTQRNRQWLHHRAAAINLKRLMALGLQHTLNGWSLAAG